MKKILALSLTLCLIGIAYAADQAPFKHYTGGGVVSATPTHNGVYNAVVSYIGVTVGDKVELVDSATAAATPVVYTVVAATANGSTPIHFTPTAAYFQNGIYYKETKTSGTFTLDIQQF